MHLIFTSYTSSPEFDCPKTWLKRIDFYTGILEKLAQTHTVTAIEHINYSGDLRQNGVRYLFQPLEKKVIRFPFRKHQLMKKMGPDVVFINGFIFPWQIIQLRLQLGKGTRIIILHRAEKPFSGYKAIIQKIADKFVSAYFFSSFDFGQSWIRKGIVNDDQKFYEILQSSSIFTSTRQKQDNSKDVYRGAYNFLWVGRLDRNKDPLTVVSAFIEFLELEPLAKLQMVYQGGNMLSALESIINATEKSRQAIKLIGSVPHQQLGDYFNDADFILSGSHYEGSGIAVIEAMSCGCIPVVTDIPSFRAITKNGEFGILYEPGNKSSMLDALLRAIGTDLDVQQEAVRLHFEQELSFEAIAKKTNEVVSQLFR
jgi:glycosyltransferase involved in cell wall biosynthesis